MSAEVAAASARADLDDNSCRQILHVTFGALLDRYGGRVVAVLRAHRETYETTVQRHFERHLEPFQE